MKGKLISPRKAQQDKDYRATIAPTEDTSKRDAAELKIVQAIHAIAKKYDALQDIARLEDLTIPALEQLMAQYGVTPEDKAEVLGVVQLQSLELMALDHGGWPAIWEGFKGRFAELFRQVATEAR